MYPIQVALIVRLRDLQRPICESYARRSAFLRGAVQSVVKLFVILRLYQCRPPSAAQLLSQLL